MGDTDMLFVAREANGTVWVGSGISRRPIGTPAEYGTLRWGTAAAQRPLIDFRTGRANPEIDQIAVCTAVELAALGVAR